MSNEKPEALEVADLFDNWSPIYGSGSRSRGATELRRQHARIQELEAMLEAVGAGGVSAPAALAVERGEVLVTVSGFTGSGKSAIAGEIEIMCRALGLQVEWPDSDSEKHMTHADWIAALEQYKPRVRIVECNVPHSVVKGQDK